MSQQDATSWSLEYGELRTLVADLTMKVYGSSKTVEATAETPFHRVRAYRDGEKVICEVTPK